MLIELYDTVFLIVKNYYSTTALQPINDICVVVWGCIFVGIYLALVRIFHTENISQIQYFSIYMIFNFVVAIIAVHILKVFFLSPAWNPKWPIVGQSLCLLCFLWVAFNTPKNRSSLWRIFRTSIICIYLSFYTPLLGASSADFLLFPTENIQLQIACFLLFLVACMAISSFILFLTGQYILEKRVFPE